jgi:hypothetical protein
VLGEYTCAPNPLRSATPRKVRWGMRQNTARQKFHFNQRNSNESIALLWFFLFASIILPASVVASASEATQSILQASFDSGLPHGYAVRNDKLSL